MENRKSEFEPIGLKIYKYLIGNGISKVEYLELIKVLKIMWLDEKSCNSFKNICKIIAEDEKKDYEKQCKCLGLKDDSKIICIDEKMISDRIEKILRDIVRTPFFDRIKSNYITKIKKLSNLDILKLLLRDLEKTIKNESENSKEKAIENILKDLSIVDIDVYKTIRRLIEYIYISDIHYGEENFETFLSKEEKDKLMLEIEKDSEERLPDLAYRKFLKNVVIRTNILKRLLDIGILVNDDIVILIDFVCYTSDGQNKALDSYIKIARKRDVNPQKITSKIQGIITDSYTNSEYGKTVNKYYSEDKYIKERFKNSAFLKIFQSESEISEMSRNDAEYTNKAISILREYDLSIIWTGYWILIEYLKALLKDKKTDNIDPISYILEHTKEYSKEEIERNIKSILLKTGSAYDLNEFLEVLKAQATSKKKIK